MVRQSAIDWLFEAIVLSVSPADLREAKAETVAGISVQKLLKIDPSAALIAVRDQWVGEQAIYHERNAHTMHLHLWSERCAVGLSKVVIGVVLLDLLLIAINQAVRAPTRTLERPAQATIWLVFVSAVLPAMVAALAGIRLRRAARHGRRLSRHSLPVRMQRLAERSHVMRTILRGHGVGNVKQGRWQQLDQLISRIEAATT